MPPHNKTKKALRRLQLQVRRKDLIESYDNKNKHEVSAKDLGLIVPYYQNQLYSSENQMVTIMDKEMTRGLSFRKRAYVPSDLMNMKNKEYGNTYEVNQPDQKYEFEPPQSANQMAFNPLQMYLTGEANYQVAAKGGNLPISQRLTYRPPPTRPRFQKRV